jgi:hypothetical protein
VLAIAGAALKRLNGLTWKSVRGPRAGQMYTRVSWEPGISRSSFFKMTGHKGLPVNPTPGISVSAPLPK